MSAPVVSWSVIAGLFASTCRAGTTASAVTATTTMACFQPMESPVKVGPPLFVTDA